MSSVAFQSPLADLLTREEAAAYLGIQVCTLASWAHSGRYRDFLPCGRIGKKSVYRRVDLDKFVASRFSPTAQ